MSTQAVIACRSEPFDELKLDTFSMAGAFIATRDYTSSVPDLSSIQCPIQLPSKFFVMSAQLVYALRLSASLGFLNSSSPTIPSPPLVSPPMACPQLYPNIQGAATRIVGLWADGGTPNETVLQDFNPVTLAQTTLWANFQANPNDVVTGCGLSRDGLTWYYYTATNILALNLTTGVTSTFITPPASHTAANTGTYSLIELPDGTLLALWKTATALRVMQYSAVGVATGFDVAMSDYGPSGVFAIEADGGAVWVLGHDPGFTSNILRRYIVSSEVLDVDETTPDAGIDYVDLLIGEFATILPVPNPTPAAAKTPCVPESEVTNGGIGHFGCNPGGVGWTSLYPDGPYDTVPQHDDPPDGEALTGKRVVDFWFEINLTDPGVSPSSVQYLRSFRPLGHLPAYQGGYKSQGLKAIGRVEHSIGNEMHTFETGTVTGDYADQEDRLFRTWLDGRSLRKGEFIVKGASPEGVAANAEPRVFARSLIEKANLSAPMNVSIEAVDQMATHFATRKYPHWTYKDCGDSMPFAPADTLELPIIPLYGESSDHGGTDPVTGAPASKGKIPGIFCGRFDLTAFGLATPPATPGYTLEALCDALEASIVTDTLDADWGGCLGHGDMTDLLTSPVPRDFTRLAAIVGGDDLRAVLDGTCGGGVTPPPDDTGWGFISFGAAEWFMIPEVFGSDLGDGEATQDRSRVPLDCATRTDILHPDHTWHLPNRYVEFTNSETGRTFWIMGVFARGQLLDDHINGIITITCNAIGIMGNANLPIIDAHAIEQHWHENFVHGDWSSGPWSDEVTYPQWGDGTPRVKTSTFAECQSLSATLMGGSPLSRGLTIGWYPKDVKTIKACIDDWDRETCSQTGTDGNWQTVKFRFNPDMSTAGFVRVDHAEHVFGTVRSVPGLDPKTVAVGSCDWDPDASKFRANPLPRKNAEGLAYNNGEELPLDPIFSTILNRDTQLEWVLDQHLLLLRFGTTYVDVPRDIGAWDTDVGRGIFLTTIEGTGANGYVNRKCIKLRKNFDFATHMVVDTLWDVEQLVTP